MEEIPSPQIEHIHFPRQVGLIKRLRSLSFVINDITIAVSIITIGTFLLKLPVAYSLLFEKQALYPFTPFIFLLSCVPLFFGAKKHLLDTHYDAKIDTRPWWIFGVPIGIGGVVALLGLSNLFVSLNSGILPIFHLSPFTSFCFFLIGLALIPPFTLLPHRFHITQFLVFIVSACNVFIILENLYELISLHVLPHATSVSVLAALAFVLYSVGLLFRWSNRGFLGNFTLDSTASVFALRVFIINLLSAPLIAFAVLLITQNSSYSMYQVLTVVVVCFSFISSLLLWANVKILYRHELEHLMMRETLRFHNIDLTKEEEKLQKKMSQLEVEKQQYLEKLKSQDAWQNAAERLG